MALPMDEQRILDEMERMLAADDPRLAARLAAFGRPGLGHVLRSGRARVTVAIMVVAVVAAVAVVVYLVSAIRLGESLRSQPPRASHSPQQFLPSTATGTAAAAEGSSTSLWRSGLQAKCGTATSARYCRTLVSAVQRER